jgi:hypothetical protein
LYDKEDVFQKTGCHSQGGDQTPPEEYGKVGKRKEYEKDSSLPPVTQNDKRESDYLNDTLVYQLFL